VAGLLPSTLPVEVAGPKPPLTPAVAGGAFALVIGFTVLDVAGQARPAARAAT
jgi:hypothetical protein